MADWEPDEDGAMTLADLRMWCLTYLAETQLAGESVAEAIANATALVEFIHEEKPRKH